MLDDFNLSDLKTSVDMTQGRAILEASGGATLHTVRAIADTGVDRISIGSLTKNIHVPDLSMRITNCF